MTFILKIKSRFCEEKNLEGAKNAWSNGSKQKCGFQTQNSRALWSVFLHKMCTQIRTFGFKVSFLCQLRCENALDL